MKILDRMVSLVLIACMLILSIGPLKVSAKEKVLTIQMAKDIGLSNSSSYKLLENKLELAYIQYEQAVKALQLKEKNQTTFRWSPLLEFSFPEDPNLSEAFEYEYKPIEMQSNIDMLEHQIEDHVYEVYNNISALFVKIYVLQEKIAFNEVRLANYTETLNKNQIRFWGGLASANDIEKIQKKVSSIESALISDKTNYEAQKKKLSNLIGINVVSGYAFENPLADAEIDRDMLEELTEHTLEVDHSYYQTREETANALLALNTNYRLMKGQYGSKLEMLDGFINAIKRGESVDAAAFKLKYNEFLKVVDEPWIGTKNIWFVKIPKEWFKGDIDGVRYVEDEPYILYECAIDYQTAQKEQAGMASELRGLVADTYENYISAQKSVQTLEKSVEEKMVELEGARKLNLLGRMTYEEYSAVQEELEELQIGLMQAHGDYSEIIYEFDRLTCGAISELLGKKSFSATSGSGGYSYIVEDEGEGVYYYIHQMAAENIFEFGLTVSEDVDLEVTHYELWIDEIQVGTRTEMGDSIKHLSLDLQRTDRVFVRLYNGDAFIDDCDIDPSVYSSKLDIIDGYTIVWNEDDLVGSYRTQIDAIGMVNLEIIPEPDELYMYYNITTEQGEFLINEDKISVRQNFKYLGLAQSSLDSLIINLYDEDKVLIYRARFDTTDQTLRKISD